MELNQSLSRFRAWSPSSRKMYYPEDIASYGYLQFSLDSSHNLLLENFHPDSRESLILMRSVLLYDKYGKELFESDLVKTDPDHITLRLKRDTLSCYDCGEITWLCQSWKICQHYIGAEHLGKYTACTCCPAGVEIIGNIYETPELKSKL